MLSAVAAKRNAHQISLGAHLSSSKQATTFDKLAERQLKSIQHLTQFDDDCGDDNDNDNDKNGDKSNRIASKWDSNSIDNAIGVRTSGRSLLARVFKPDLDNDDSPVGTVLNSGELGDVEKNSINWMSNGTNNSDESDPLVETRSNGQRKTKQQKMQQLSQIHQLFDTRPSSVDIKLKKITTTTTTEPMRTIGENHDDEYTLLADGDLWAVE